MRRTPTSQRALTVAIAATFLFGGSAVVAPMAVADPASEAAGALVPLIGTAEVAVGINGFEGASDVAVAEDGTVYVADEAAGQVFTVSPDGSTDVVAGSGTVVVDGGDDGLATDAYLELPAAVAVDDDGTLYIADKADYTVRAVDTDGAIRTAYSADVDEYADGASAGLSLAASGDGVYVGVPEGGVVHVDQEDDVEQVLEADEFPGDEVPRGLDLAEDGTLYVATGAEVYTEDDGSLSPALGGGDRDGAYARDVAVGDGVIYIAGKDGLLVYDGDDLDVHTALDSRHVALHDESLYVLDEFASSPGDREITTTVWQTPVDIAELSPPSHSTSNEGEASAEAEAGELESYDSGTLLPGPIEVPIGAGRPETLAAGPDGSLVVATDHAFLEGQSSVESTNPGRSLYPFAATHVIDVAIGGDGSLFYLARGLIQLFPDGSATLLTEWDTGIQSLAVGDGVVYAATTDAVFTVGDNAELVPFIDLADEYGGDREIGDLAVASDGSLMVLDRRQSELLHVDADGEPRSEVDLSQSDQGSFSAFDIAVAAGEDAEIYVLGRRELSEESGTTARESAVILRITDLEERDSSVEIAGSSPDIDAESPPAPAQVMFLDAPHSLSLDTAGNLHFIDDRDTYMIRDAAGAPSEAQEKRNTILGMSLAVLLALGVAAGVLRYIAVRQRAMANSAEA